MNFFEQKQEAKRERMLKRADKAESKADQDWETNKRISEAMAGTPILVGHHSEKRHRRELEKMDNRDRRSFENREKANYLRNRAESIGDGGVMSDDPEAVKKLCEKLAAMESDREKMKEINKSWKRYKSKGDKSDLSKYFSDEAIKELEAKVERAYSWEKQPYPSYTISNLGARIRTTKKRIEDLRAMNVPSEHEQEVREFDNFTVSELEGRYNLKFPGKPDPDTRRVLKQYGFKWSPYAKSWVRKITPNAKRSLEYAIQDLKNREIKFE